MKSSITHREFIHQQIARIQSMPSTDYVRYIVVPHAYSKQTVQLLAATTLTNVVVTTQKHFFTTLLEQINPFKSTYIEESELVLHCLEVLAKDLNEHPLIDGKENLLDIATKLACQVQECQMTMCTEIASHDLAYLKDKTDLFNSVYKHVSSLNTYPKVISQLLELVIPKIELIISYDMTVTSLEAAILNRIDDKFENELLNIEFDFTHKKPLEVIAATYDRIEIEYVFARIMALSCQGVALSDIQIVCSNESLLQKVIQQAYKYNVPLTYSMSRALKPNFDVTALPCLTSIDVYTQMLKAGIESDSYWQSLLDIVLTYNRIITSEIPKNTYLQLLEMASNSQQMETSQALGIKVVQVMQESHCDHTFMLGIDENYFAKPFSDNDYFNLQDRQNLAQLSNVMLMHHQKWQRYLADLYLNDYQTLVMSHSSVDFSGKQLFASYLIKDIVPTKIETHAIELKKHDVAYIKQQKRQLANIPYPDTLKSSVSSLEAFYGCPYQYFLRYGLKIPSFRTERSDSLYIGSMFHNHLAVELLNPDSKIPPTRDMIAQMIESYFIENPFDEPEWYKQLLKHNLSLHFENVFKMQFFFLNQGEFKVVDVEKDFALEMNTIQKDFKHSVLFRGSIDRVDYTNKYIRIIDYKTGNKVIDYDQIGLGLSLQLPMYGLIANHLYNLDVSFMGYARFGETFQSISSDQDDIGFEKWRRNYRFSGLQLDLDDAIEIQDVHMISLKGNQTSDVMSVKGKSQKTQKYASKSLVSPLAMQSLYKHVVDKVDSAITHIKSGMIDLEPYETKCEFCDYQSVCGFDQQLHTLKPIKDKQEIIKQMLSKELDNG